MSEEYKLSESEKALQVAQMLLAQGNSAAAVPILNNILTSHGNNSLEGALCLTTLTDIYESQGNIESAADCAIQLVNHQRLYQQVPPIVKAANANRAATFLESIGNAADAFRFRSMANEIGQRPSAPPGNVESSPNSMWLMQSLQEAAMRTISTHKKLSSQPPASNAPVPRPAPGAPIVNGNGAPNAVPPVRAAGSAPHTTGPNPIIKMPLMQAPLMQSPMMQAPLIQIPPDSTAPRNVPSNNAAPPVSPQSPQSQSAFAQPSAHSPVAQSVAQSAPGSVPPHQPTYQMPASSQAIEHPNPGQMQPAAMNVADGAPRASFTQPQSSNVPPHQVPGKAGQMPAEMQSNAPTLSQPHEMQMPNGSPQMQPPPMPPVQMQAAQMQSPQMQSSRARAPHAVAQPELGHTHQTSERPIAQANHRAEGSTQTQPQEPSAPLFEPEGDDQNGFQVQDIIYKMSGAEKKLRENVKDGSNNSRTTEERVFKPQGGNGSRRKETKEKKGGRDKGPRTRESEAPPAGSFQENTLDAGARRRPTKDRKVADLAGPTVFDKLGEMLAGAADQPNDGKFSEPQKLEAPQRQGSALVGVLALLAVVAIGGIAAWNLTPRAGDPQALFLRSPHRYKDASQTKLMWWVSPKEAELTTGSAKQHANLKFYFNDWRDIVTIMFGQINERYAYVKSYDTLLQDGNGTILYDAESPEAQLGDRAVLIRDDAEAYFQKNKKYPTDTKFTPKYENPYVKKEMKQPVFTNVSFGSAQNEEGEKQRAEFYAAVATGQFWQDQKIKLEAGDIACCNAIFKSARGDINSFVVTAAGTDGTLLGGLESGTVFELASEDGKARKVELPKDKCSTVWITVRPIPPQLTFWLQNGASLAFLLCSVFSLSFGLSSSKKDPSRGVWFIASGASALVAALYFGFAHFR